MNRDIRSRGKGGQARISVSQGFGTPLDAEVGSSLTHEGLHGMDAKAIGQPRNGMEEYLGEMRAYGSEAYFWEGLGIDDPLGLWTRAGGRNLGKIRDSAADSTKIWCSRGGSCP